MCDSWEDDWEIGAENFQVKVSLIDPEAHEDEWESPCDGYIAASSNYLTGLVYDWQCNGF